MLVRQVIDIISDYFPKTKVGYFSYPPLKYLEKQTNNNMGRISKEQTGCFRTFSNNSAAGPSLSHSSASTSFTSFTGSPTEKCGRLNLVVLLLPISSANLMSNDIICCLPHGYKRHLSKTHCSTSLVVSHVEDCVLP